MRQVGRRWRSRGRDSGRWKRIITENRRAGILRPKANGLANDASVARARVDVHGDIKCLPHDFRVFRRDACPARGDLREARINTLQHDHTVIRRIAIVHHVVEVLDSEQGAGGGRRRGIDEIAGAKIIGCRGARVGAEDHTASRA